MANRTLAFLGFGKQAVKKEDETEEEKAARLAAEKKAKSPAEEEDDDANEEDDDEDAADKDQREAAIARNALRGAGHRRGARAERDRIGAIMNGVDASHAELALGLALNSDMSAEKVGKTLKRVSKAGVGLGASAATSFAATMGRLASETDQPSFGGGAPAKGPTLAGQMAKTLKLPAPTY